MDHLPSETGVRRFPRVDLRRVMRAAAKRASLLALLLVVAWLAQGPLLVVPLPTPSPFPGPGGGLEPDPVLATGALAGTVIILDPGHGGRDPGAISGGVYEKDIVLALSHMLREMLTDAGAIVVMTRETDIDLSADIPGKRKLTDLDARLRIVADVGPDAFISVHANHFSPARWRGAQVFYNEINPHNVQLARLIQAELEPVFGVHRAVQRDERQYILKSLAIPAVCVETGFMSNPEDLRMLQDPAEQRRIAWAICRGLARFLAGLTTPVATP